MNGSYDLTEAFSSTPLQYPKYGSLVRSLRNLEAAISVQADLAEAREALDVIAFQQQELPSKQLSIQVEALFVLALMLYCRATHSRSKARHPIDVINQYSSELRVFHKDISALRDHVIAHYGPGDAQKSGPWAIDHVAIHINSKGFEFSFPQKRVAYKAEHIIALEKLVDASSAYIFRYGTEKQHEVASFLSEFLPKDRILQGLVKAHPFNEVDFFGRRYPPGSRDRPIVPAGTKPTEPPREN